MLPAFLMPDDDVPSGKEREIVGRKNRRSKIEYRDRLGFNPRKYIQSNKSNPQKLQKSQMKRETPEQTTYRPYRIPYRGEVWFAELGFHPGTSVQDGCRPVLVISNDKGNHHANTIVVLPMTSHLKKCDLPSHVELLQKDLTKADLNRPLEPSMILAEQITTIAKSALRNYVGKVEAVDKLAEIDIAVKTQLGILSDHERMTI